MARIAILMPSFGGGGTERVNIDLAKEFVRLGHTVDFVVQHVSGEFMEEIDAGYRVFELGAKRTAGVIMRFAAYLRSERPDAVLANKWPLYIAAPLARTIARHPCKVVVLEHDPRWLEQRAFRNWRKLATRLQLAFAFRLADARVGVSRGVANDMAKNARMPKSRMEVIYNPVPERIEPSAGEIARAEAMWGPGRTPRILTVGFMTSRKNPRLLLAAFLTLASQFDGRLMFVGHGPHKRRMQLMAQGLGIGDRVIFAGYQPDVTPFYRTADLFVLPSLEEGFGLVLVEALAEGLPVVATDCPCGPAEVLDNGKYGRLVPVNNVDEMAAAIFEALGAEHDREALRRRAAEFAPEIAARKYLALLTGEG